MLNRIIHFALHNRLLVLLAAVVITIGGLFTAHESEVDVFPDLNAPTVVIMTEANGMAAEEVEQLVTFPLETAVNGATGVRRVRSSSTMGFSVVWVEFDWGTNIYTARQIVTEKLTAVSESLPPSVGSPTIGPQSSILGELLIVGLTSDHTSALDLRTLADWTVRPRLLSTGGVAQVAVLGGDIKEFQILFDPGKMKHYGVTLQELMDATRTMNSNINGGVINQFGNEYIVRGIISTDDVDQLGHSVIKLNNDAPITLADIAEVQIGAQEPRLGCASERGKPAVLLTITKQPNTDTKRLTAELEDALADLQKNLPADVHVSTDIFRQSRFIESSIDNVSRSLLEGAFFVIIILAIFLANTRTTIISLVTIPISLLISVMALHALGLTLNTMSLGGLAIAIGSLVDDAIVDVENVWRKLHGPQHAGTSVIDVIFEASREVRVPILNSTLIIVASFAPLFFLSGMEGRMLIPLGIAFIVALFASTLVALTLTPVLCSYLLKPGPSGRAAAHRGETLLVRGMKRGYERTLTWVLHHKTLVLSTTAVLFVVASINFLRLGHSFLPPFNEGSLTINISSLPGISLEESNKIGLQAEKLLLSIPEIKTVGRKTGRAELDEHALGVNVSEIEAPFELDQRSADEVLADVRQKLSTIVGANIEIGQPISHRIDAMLSGTQANIAIKLFGDNLNNLFTIGNEIKASIADVPGIADLNVEQQIERPELKIVPNREMLLRRGITLPQFNEFIAVNMAGETVAQVSEGGKSFSLIVRADEANRNTIEHIRSLTIDAANGDRVPLADVADVTSSMGPNTINRENVKRKIVISANCNGRDIGSIVADIQRRVDADIHLPEGYHIEYGGQFESEQAASRILLLASILSIIVIFILLNTQFRNPRESGIILLNLPLALIGGVFALTFTTRELSIPAIIGFISLFGIATRNGMLLITQYNQLRTQAGHTVRESVVRGSLDRLNPIIMTAMTSALALIPLALRGDLPGNEIQSPMAKVILGGLLTSTFLNAFVIPIVYEWLHSEHTGRKHSLFTRRHRAVPAKVILLALLTLSPIAATADNSPSSTEGLSGILALIEQNNPQLIAARRSVQAEVASQEANITLAPTSIEYSPFFHRGIRGLASSELIVSQEFDFPTLYKQRHRSVALLHDALDRQYDILRRDILLQATCLCYDLVANRRTLQLLHQRAATADSLLAVYERRLQLGHATAIDVNRIRLDRMTLQTETATTTGEGVALRRQLETLNGGEPIGGMADFEPMIETFVLPTAEAVESRETAAAEAELSAASHEAKLSKKSWYPTFTVGYRRNTELHEANGGFLVGVAFPIFGNSKKQRAAQLRVSAAEAQLASAHTETLTRQQRLTTQAESLRSTLSSYDVPLMQETLRLLQRAVLAGELSIIDYYTEAERIYTMLQQRIVIENEYFKTAVEIQRENL